MSDMNGIHVTPKWWDRLYVQQRLGAQYAVRARTWIWVVAASFQPGRFGNAMAKVVGVAHDDRGLTMIFGHDHGENLEALRGAVMDRFDSPDLEQTIADAIEASRRIASTIKIERVGP